MEVSKYLIVVAGGQGTRMGTAIPKQFLLLKDKPILRRTIEKFIEAVPLIRVVTVLPDSLVDYWKDYCFNYNFTCPQTMVKGGITRFHSVRNAISKVPDGALVAVHDGVRPLLSVSMIRRMFEKMEKETAEGLIPVIPSVDTLIALEERKDEDGTKELRELDGQRIDRSKVWAVQTPQIFRSETLREAYSQPFDPSFTDDGSVLRAIGKPLAYCAGERFNLKITTPEDISLAEALMSNGLS